MWISDEYKRLINCDNVINIYIFTVKEDGQEKWTIVAESVKSQVDSPVMVALIKAETDFKEVEKKLNYIKAALTTETKLLDLL